MINQCPARCGLTGGCAQCQPRPHRSVLVDLLRLQAMMQPPVGWLCPRCGAGVAPGVEACPCWRTTYTGGA